MLLTAKAFRSNPSPVAIRALTEERDDATGIERAGRTRAQIGLRSSEERYALAALGANDGLWDWDLKTNEICLSPRFNEMLGLEEGACSRQSKEWLSRVHPSDRDRLGMEIVAHLEGLSAHFEGEHRMRHQNGSWRWMLCRGLAVRDHHGRAYRFAGSLTDITEHKLLQEQVQHDAFRDALTGLPNRALFMDRAGRAVERSKRNPDYAFAVLAVHLDRIKLINDGLGYKAGDELIRRAASRIAHCLRPEDTVARLGAAEFALLLEDIGDVTETTRVVTRIATALQAPFGPQELVVTASMGIALSSTGYEDAEDVLRDAAIALHRAKAGGRARYAVFDPEMHRRALEQLEIETDLRHGLERTEFTVCYQPIVAIGSGELSGFEALLRWRHPSRGLVRPTEFVGVAEETGLIVALGQWILSEACRQAGEWRERFGVSLPVSVNISGRQLMEADVVERVAAILEETGLPGPLLNLEVTESVIMDNMDAATEKLRHLKDMGIGVSIDDFGTGYSCLSLLHRFPIDTLKLDRSFVARIPGEGGPIVRAIVGLADNLGMRVVAEGVETAQQRDWLAGLDCGFGQGYLFSEAVPSARAADLIVAPTRW